MKSKFSALLTLLILLIFSASFAQEIAITGKVTSMEDGTALPGVNVLLKGTTKGTVTDIDGNYTIAVPEGEGTLVFSFIGYATKEVGIANRTTVDIAMVTDVRQLSEIVVTSAGIEKQRRSVGYAVEELEADAIQQRAEPDLVRALQGKTPGVEIIGNNGAPGSASSITIRGYNTTGGNQPLIVVDGVPFNNEATRDPIGGSSNPLQGNSSFSNRLLDLNPNDIENITVLRGASASVLYGSRAANGVVLITTKSGKGGRSSKGFSLTYNGSYNTEEVQRTPDFQNTFGQGGDFAYDGGFFSTWGPAFSSLDSVPHHYSGEEWANVFPEFQGKKVPYQGYPNSIKDFYDIGGVLENSISLTGGDGNGSFNASFSRTDHNGFIPGTEYTRNNFNVGGQITSDLGIRFGGTLSYMKSEQQGIQTGGGAGGASPVHSQLWYIPRSLDLLGYPYQDPVTGDNVWYRDGLDNPIWSTENNLYSSVVDRAWGNLYAEYSPATWLDLSYKFGINQFTDKRKDFIEYSSTVRPSTFNEQGGLLYDDIFFQEVNSRFLATFKPVNTERFGLNLILGNEINERQTERRRTLGTGLITRGIDEMGNTTTQLYDQGGRTKLRIMGFFGDVNFSFQNWAFVNYQARMDISSTLPLDNNSFFYQGINGSVIFTDAFDISNDILSYGKIRIGYGKVGRDADPYSLTSVYTANTTAGNNTANIGGPFGGVSYLVNGAGVGDPGLTPEFTTELETGAELQFFDGRLGVDFTWYDRTTSDIILLVTRPSSSGFVQQVTNAGEIQNRGIELGLDITPIQVGDFSWNLFTAFTRNRNEVKKLAEGMKQFDLAFGFTGDFGARMIPGQPFGVIEGSAFERTPDGQIMMDANEGIPLQTQESKIIADPNRDFNLAFTNTFTYKGFSLNVMVDYLAGGQYYSNTVAHMLGRGVLEQTAVDRYTPRVIEGVLADPTTREPLLDDAGNFIPNDVQITTGDYFWRGLYGSNSAHEASVFDATVIKLREINLGYNLPASLMANTPFSNARISFSGRNLWFWAPGLPKGSAVDPDNGGGQLIDGVRGFDFAYVPNARRYGINLSFTL